MLAQNALAQIIISIMEAVQLAQAEAIAMEFPNMQHAQGMAIIVIHQESTSAALNFQHNAKLVTLADVPLVMADIMQITANAVLVR